MEGLLLLLLLLLRRRSVALHGSGQLNSERKVQMQSALGEVSVQTYGQLPPEL